MFNEREKILLQILLKTGEALSIKELSKSTKIKERTLYREIKNLELSLKQLGLILLKEKSKYRLVGDTSVLDASLLKSDFIDHAYSIDTRLNLILCFLILNEDTSIKDISEKLLLSYNTVATTIITVEKILADYKLSLVRKKGQGIELIGKESDRRVLLISILCNEINDEEFFSKINKKESLSNNPFIKFLNFDFLAELFNNNKELKIFNLYTDSSIKKILISLNVIFLRISYVTDCEENFSTTEYNYVIALLETAKKYIEYDITKDMEKFLIRILKTCRLIEQLSYFNDKYSYILVYKINLLIKHVSERMNVDFTQDTNLSSGLIAHVESAIKRYQMKLKEENEELLEFVLKNYNELYLIIKSELLTVFDEINFSSTELSYIVIHFASCYEQIYRKNFIRALVICSSGIGSSKILGSQIRKNIPEIKNLEYIIPGKLGETNLNNYDVIISTIELNKEIDYLLIPTILKEKDVDTIREKILNSRSFKRKKLIPREKVNEEKFLLPACEEILRNVYVSELFTADTDIKNMLVDIFKKVNLKSGNQQNIIENLIGRHEKSSVVIPKTKLALFHTLENSLTEPFVIICNLKNEIELINVSLNKEMVRTFFIMVSPNEERYTNFLGQISIAILNDEVLIKAINSKNREFIMTKLELILKDYIIQND